MRILVLGCQGAGLHLVPMLAQEGHQVVAIDDDIEVVEELSSRENVRGVLYSEPMLDNLRQAGLSNADVFLALTDKDSHNCMAAQVAQHIFHVPKVFCRIDDPHRQKVYEQLGLSVVSPTMSLVDAIYSGLKA